MLHDIERVINEIQVVLNSTKNKNYKVNDETFGRDIVYLEVPLDIFDPDQLISIAPKVKELHGKYVSLRNKEIESIRKIRQDEYMKESLLSRDIGL